MQLNPPKEPEEFFIWLKKESERFWEKDRIDHAVYGFQIQKGTKWNPPLNETQVAEYESELGFRFPEMYRTFLQHMNGTDKLALNVYGECGEPYRYAPEYYSYPRDLRLVKEMVEWICESFKIEVADIDGDKIPFLLPIVSHRILIVDKADKNPVLSMYGDDVIPIAYSLKTFLVNDIFRGHMQENNLPCVSLEFWLE
jgi:hypothetical protein